SSDTFNLIAIVRFTKAIVKTQKFFFNTQGAALPPSPKGLGFRAVIRMKILILISCCSSLFGASFTWTGVSTNTWADAANWTPNTGFPNAIDDVAIFPATFTNQPDIGVTTEIVGTIQLNSTPTSTTISGTGLLNFSVSSGSASIAATTTGHQIKPNITLTSALTTSIAQSCLVTISGNISGTPSFTVGGAGTTALTGSNSFSGGVIVNSGSTLQVNSDSALGALSNSVTLSGTLQASGTITSARSFNLGSAIIDTFAQTITLSGSLNGNSLTKIGTGTLVLSGANNYAGGTSINLGTLKIFSDQNLGLSTSSLTLANNTILQAGAAFALSASRNITLNGAVTIDTSSFSPTIASNITGSGSLTVSGTQLTLTGTNSYTGPTSVNSAKLIGNTMSLQGNINAINSGTVNFHQATNGTYAGAYNGASGTTLLLDGGGTYTFTGNSSSSLSTTQLSNANLIISGMLGSSSFSIDASSTLSGTGTLLTTLGVSNSGKIKPGNALGTLAINGNLTFTPGSGTLVSQIEPFVSSLLQVSGTATLTDGILSLQFDPALFYPLTNTYTLLKAGSVVGTFGTVLSSNQQFSPTIIYSPTSVELFLTNFSPFANFPFGNANERAVGRNIDALSAASLLSADFVAVIDSLAGETISEVNRALDQMHPAQMSALAELQTALGGQLLNCLHQRSGFSCGCNCGEDSFFWIEPFGNWLRQKKEGMQIGFQATTRGLSIGFDHEFFDAWNLGIAGSCQETDLHWTKARGYSYIRGAYGALYSDLNLGRFYLGSSAYAGKDSSQGVRKIRFSTIDRQAKSHFHSLNAGGQVTTAYFFGNRSFHLFPYGTVDLLYLENAAFSEHGARSLNLDVQKYRSSTLRAESGLAMRFVDRNRDNTFCITPLFSMGYVLDLPLHRDHFRARFDGVPIPFRTEGWTMAWQLLNLRFGLTLTYRCFLIDSQYVADLSTEGNKPYVNQRANFRLGLQF
ncbi:MAG TPA: autotransporter domain-containing protein, partial [Chlamydiales bacterium]|nr:autotransporter domain-containing protein [Chlamydiales bacterium]